MDPITLELLVEPIISIKSKIKNNNVIYKFNAITLDKSIRKSLKFENPLNREELSINNIKELDKLCKKYHEKKKKKSLYDIWKIKDKLLKEQFKKEINRISLEADFNRNINRIFITILFYNQVVAEELLINYLNEFIELLLCCENSHEKQQYIEMALEKIMEPFIRKKGMLPTKCLGFAIYELNKLLQQFEPFFIIEES